MTYNSGFKFISTNAELAAAALELVKYDVLGVDTETAYWRMGKKYEKLALLQIAFFEKEQRTRAKSRVFIIDTMRPLKFELLSAALENASILKVMHNASFDAEKLLTHLDIKCRNIWCTMRAERRLGKKSGNKLDQLAEGYFQIKVDKTDQDFPWETRPLKPAQLFYAAKDAVLPLWLYLEQKGKGMNGKYEYFTELEQDLPLTSGETFGQESKVSNLHVWLRDWIASGGHQLYPDQELWIGAKPVYRIYYLAHFAPELERIITNLDKFWSAYRRSKEDLGCCPAPDPDYWIKVLQALHERVVLGLITPEIERLEEMSRRIKREFREHCDKLELEGEREKAEIEAMAAEAEVSALIEGREPDYTLLLQRCAQMYRPDLGRGYRKSRHTR